MITASDLVAILPLIIVAGGWVLAMLAIAVRRSHAFTAGSTMSILVPAFVSMFLVVPVVPRAVTPLLVVDKFHCSSRAFCWQPGLSSPFFAIAICRNLQLGAKSSICSCSSL